MSFFYTCVIFILGLILLIKSSDLLVDSCVGLSFLLKLSPLFIGLILVAFGTSAPEAGVTITAVLTGEKSIALGNIIGSNIVNIGLVIGLCGLFFPTPIEKKILDREVPFLLFATLFFGFLGLDGELSRLDGIFMLFFLLIFIVLSLRSAKHNMAEPEIAMLPFFKKIKSGWVMTGFIFIFLAGIILGANLMVRSGIIIARLLGIKPWIIGITVFAIGTSLPEFAASLNASFKRVHALSIGNVIGSNIFNILFVLGLASFIKPIDIPDTIICFEFPVLLLFTIIFSVIMYTGRMITRLESGFLVFMYAVFMFFLFK
ncbi:MAG: sodium:calcium antiporter [Candidatus Omnitrophota bacterium]